MSTLPRRRLETLVGVVWLALVIVSVWLWLLFLDPAALPAEGSWGARVLARLGRVHYDDPALIARVRVTRIAVLATFASVGFILVLERARVIRKIEQFFTEPSHPVNLAIFRIVLLLQAYSLTYFDYVSRIAALPDSLQFPPATTVPEIGPLAPLAHWPRNPLTPEQAEIAGTIMVAACFTGMFGLFSRASTFVVAVAFFYGWGAIQWYGKVDHHHHVLWFALVLAASPCGDALSVDALVRSWRLKRRGISASPRESVAYGLPLRICMVLMGVLYFFPGCWKIWRSGFDWFLGDNAYNVTYLKWHMLGRWLPPFRFDHHPLLVRVGAAGTIFFELSFLFLIFGRWTRYAAAIMGVTFHTAIDVFMRHGFETLRNCYVIFVDWHALGRRVRHRFVPRKPAGVLAPPVPARSVAGVALVGAALIAANVWAGANRMMDAWPIACYPLFDGLIGDSYTTLRITAVAQDGSERTLIPTDYRATFGDRWTHLLEHVIEQPDEQRRGDLLRVIWDVMAREDPSLLRARRVRFFTVRSWIHPDQWTRPPGTPELIYEATL